jgi:hypothetical protein
MATSDSMTDYAAFLRSKSRTFGGDGIAAATLPSTLYDWQAAIVRWALRKGRAAIFADCGLGKSFMQIAWADALNARVLMFAPLCVAEQTISEARKLGIEIRYAHDQHEATGRLTITNYERLDRFDPAAFDGVVLDESSILKSMDGKTRTSLIDMFGDTRYRLCCTATPSPNDIAELANHAEFLGLSTRPEFLATWFVHDDEGWRMKRHAVEPFYRWLGSWAVALRSPAELGCEAGGFNLPPLEIRDLIVGADGPADGMLFADMALKGLTGRLTARKTSLAHRLDATAELVRGTPGAWLVWCGLNAESDGMAARLGDDCVNVQGSDSHAEKVGAVQAFLAGDVRVMLSKAKIMGFGLNFQHCHNMAFLGLSDSYETYYQCIRRAWRYGQKHPVTATIVVSEAEAGIVANVRRKEQAAISLADHLGPHTRRELTPYLEAVA